MRRLVLLANPLQFSHRRGKFSVGKKRRSDGAVKVHAYPKELQQILGEFATRCHQSLRLQTQGDLLKPTGHLLKVT